MWQPIDSAPNDCTDVLVWDGKRVMIAKKSKNGSWCGGNTEECIYLETAEESEEGEGLTHWQPLPPPPEK